MNDLNSTDDCRMNDIILPDLPNDCLCKIACFMDLNECAAVCKSFYKMSSDNALRLLNQRPFDDTYMQRLQGKVDESMQQRVSNDAVHPRLLLRVANRVPLVQMRINRIGPTVVLPSGNVVTVYSEPDNRMQNVWRVVPRTRVVIRVIDTRTKRLITMEAPRGFHPNLEDPLQSGRPPICPFSDKLFYSNGHLVLLCHNTRWLHVWKVDEEQEPLLEVNFVYSRRFRCDGPDAVAVAADSLMYLLCRDSDVPAVSYTLEALELSTGQQVCSRAIHMPVATENTPNYTIDSLVVAEKHLLMFRYIEEDGAFLEQGIGAYSFRRDDLSLIDFLPCLFDREETRMAHDESTRAMSECVVFTQFNPRMSKKVVVQNGGFLSFQDCAFHPVYDVVATTPTSVFEHAEWESDDDWVHELVEYDRATGRALRTLSLDGFRDAHQVARVLVSPERGELFMIISDKVGGVHSISTFPL